MKSRRDAKQNVVEQWQQRKIQRRERIPTRSSATATAQAKLMQEEETTVNTKDRTAYYSPTNAVPAVDSPDQIVTGGIPSSLKPKQQHDHNHELPGICAIFKTLFHRSNQRNSESTEEDFSSSQVTERYRREYPRGKPPRTSSSPGGNKQRDRSNNGTTTALFPSVLTILQSHKLTKQLQRTKSETTESLSVLPKGYENIHQALQKISQQQRRAFWLMDYSSCVLKFIQYQKNWNMAITRLAYQLTWCHHPVMLKLMNEYNVMHLVRQSNEFQSCTEKDGPRRFSSNSIAMATTQQPNSFYRQAIKNDVEFIMVKDQGQVEQIQRLLLKMEKEGICKGEERKRPRVKLLFDATQTGNPTQELDRILNTCTDQTPLVGFQLPLLTEDSIEEVKERILPALTSRIGSAFVILVQIDAALPTPVMQFIKDLQLTPGISHLIVDTTRALTPVALCSRIIGVRPNGKNGRHYYIDDGCYGSLTSNMTPMPLQKEANDDSVFSSTVWGPTCDGLDKVASGVPLPKLEQDDWLVFEGVSSAGLSTNFNGFSPPDTVFCILGYYK